MMADRELPQGATSGCQVVDDAKSADRGTGASILELALVLPALVIILLGLIEFATAFYTYPILLEGARSGAHSAAKLNPGGANPGQLIRDTAVEAACSYIGDAGLSATGYRVTVRRDWLGGRRAVRVTVERPENSWTIFALMLRHYQASVVFRLRTAIGPAPGVSTTECS